MNESSLCTVPYRKLESALMKIASNYYEMGLELDDCQISFEAIIGSFFPEVLENINNAIKDAYTQGFIQGKKEGSNDSSDNANGVL